MSAVTDRTSTNQFAPAAEGDREPQSPRRWVRYAVIGVLLADVVALSVTPVVGGHRSDPAPVRGPVVESRCVDGRITQAIDDGNPAGWLAYDTGVSC
jgi:hypothetical protein